MSEKEEKRSRQARCPLVGQFFETPNFTIAQKGGKTHLDIFVEHVKAECLKC